jgi:hypothetical protein
MTTIDNSNDDVAVDDPDDNSSHGRWDDDTTTVDDVDYDDDDLVERSSVALFAGDEGGLSREQRDCLVYLLKNHYLSHDQKPTMWQVLMEHQPAIRARLNDLYLNLHVDLEGQVAYKRQAAPDNGGPNFPTLLHDRAYNREQTILLVYLRERLHRQRAAGDGQVLVDREDMIDRVLEFKAADDTDLSGAQTRATNSIDALKKMGVLYGSADSDRFTISPVLDSLMPLARLQELLEWLRAETARTDSNDEDGKDGVA